MERARLAQRVTTGNSRSHSPVWLRYANDHSCGCRCGIGAPCHRCRRAHRCARAGGARRCHCGSARSATRCLTPPRPNASPRPSNHRSGPEAARARESTGQGSPLGELIAPCAAAVLRRQARAVFEPSSAASPMPAGGDSPPPRCNLPLPRPVASPVVSNTCPRVPLNAVPVQETVRTNR